MSHASVWLLEVAMHDPLAPTLAVVAVLGLVLFLRKPRARTRCVVRTFGPGFRPVVCRKGFGRCDCPACKEKLS